MFKLQPNPTFFAKVGIPIAGQEKLEIIDVEYKYLTRTALKSYFEGLKGKTDAQALGEIVIGWRIPDVEFSASALETLIDNYPAAAEAFFESFKAELMEAKRKN